MGHHVKQSQGGLGFKDGTGFPPVMSNGGFEMYPESGNPFIQSIGQNIVDCSSMKELNTEYIYFFYGILYFYPLLSNQQIPPILV
jgi:hypothetical protein